MRTLSAVLALLAVLVTLGMPRAACATEPDATEIAREEYARGNALARATQWGEALGAFEASLRVRPHALTLYNIGVCERVLGRATRARQRFHEALARADADATSSVRRSLPRPTSTALAASSREPR